MFKCLQTHRTTRSSKLREREPVSSPKAEPTHDDLLDKSGTGYNSGDEYDGRHVNEITETEWVEVSSTHSYAGNSFETVNTVLKSHVFLIVFCIVYAVCFSLHRWTNISETL